MCKGNGSKTSKRLLAAGAILVVFSTMHNAKAGDQTRADAQAAGLSLGSSVLSTGTLSPAASSQSATTPSSGNVWGSAYTGSTNTTLSGKKSSPSMIGIGNGARTEASSSFSGYNSTREDQGSQATYFLDRNPILKPTFTPNDPLFRAINLSTPDVFASSSSKSCKQTVIKTPLDNANIQSCVETFNPYVVSCSGNAQVSFDKVPGRDSGATLPGVVSIPPGWGPYIDHYLVMKMSCANNGAGYNLTVFTSQDSVNPYMSIFSNVYIPGKIGATQGNTYIGNGSPNCTWPYYFSQSCDGSNCNTRLKLIGSGCNGGDFDIGTVNPIPMVDKMVDSTSATCAALEGLAAP